MLLHLQQNCLTAIGMLKIYTYQMFQNAMHIPQNLTHKKVHNILRLYSFTFLMQQSMELSLCTE